MANWIYIAAVFLSKTADTHGNSLRPFDFMISFQGSPLLWFYHFQNSSVLASHLLLLYLSIQMFPFLFFFYFVSLVHFSTLVFLLRGWRVNLCLAEQANLWPLYHVNWWFTSELILEFALDLLPVITVILSYPFPMAGLRVALTILFRMRVAGANRFDIFMSI